MSQDILKIKNLTNILVDLLQYQTALLILKKEQLLELLGQMDLEKQHCLI